MFRIYADNVEITDKVLADSISISKIYCDGQLSLSQVSSEQLKLSTTEDLNLTGKKLRLKWDEYFVVSDYTVTYSAKVQNSNTVNLTAYDDLKKFDKDVSDYYNSLAETFTLKELVEGLGTYVGVSISVPSWAVNSTKLLHKTIAPSKLNGLDLMGKACELMGMWLCCWSGQTSWRKLTRNNGEIIRHTVGANAYKRKDYNTYPIKRVAIKTEEGDVGVVSGTGGSCYTVLGNYLVYGNDQLQGFADDLLTELDGLSYRPCEIEIPITDFCLISAQYVYGDDYFLGMEKEIGNTIKVKCHGTEYLEEPESTAVDIEIIKGQSNVIKNDVNGLKQRVTTIEGDYVKESEITVISGEIKAEVKEEIKDDYVPVEGGTKTSAASWSLKPEAFSVSSNGKEVLKVNSNGLEVNGKGAFSGDITGTKMIANRVITQDVQGVNWTKQTNMRDGKVQVVIDDVNDAAKVFEASGTEIALKKYAEYEYTEYTLKKPDGTTESVREFTDGDMETDIFVSNENETIIDSKQINIGAPSNAQNAIATERVTIESKATDVTSAKTRFFGDVEIDETLDTTTGKFIGGNLAVAGTISEGGTSLPNKYQPKGAYALSNHIQAYTAEQCTSYTADTDTMGLTPAAVKKAFTIFEPKSHTHTISQITDFPTPLKGDTGYSIVASVSRTTFTEANWNTYGTVGHTEGWSNTSASRNGCRVGDIFLVVGTATDTKNAHVLYYQSTTASGDLRGICLAHSIAESTRAQGSFTHLFFTRDAQKNQTFALSTFMQYKYIALYTGTDYSSSGGIVYPNDSSGCDIIPTDTLRCMFNMAKAIGDEGSMYTRSKNGGTISLYRSGDSNILVQSTGSGDANFIIGFN